VEGLKVWKGCRFTREKVGNGWRIIGKWSERWEVWREKGLGVGRVIG
jgi:hypothetical protein